MNNLKKTSLLLGCVVLLYFIMPTSRAFGQFTNEGGWIEPVRLDSESTNGYHPYTSVDAEGTIHVVWYGVVGYKRDSNWVGNTFFYSKSGYGMAGSNSHSRNRRIAACDFPPIRDIYYRFEFGVLFTPNKPVAIADALDSYFNLPEEKKVAIRANLEKARRAYSWVNESKKWLYIYEEMV